MYILVPLIIILISAVTGAVIIWRKFPYLKKLPVDAVAVSETGLWEGFFPEVYRFFQKVDFGFYRHLFFKELEKFLRRLRVVSLKIDSFTKHLIDKIRTKGTKREIIKHLTPEKEGKDQEEAVQVFSEISKEERQKKEEHDLIIEIAKNPKNAELYKKLADLYILAENFSDAAEALETAMKLDPDDKKTAAKLRAVQKALPT